MALWRVGYCDNCHLQKNPAVNGFLLYGVTLPKHEQHKTKEKHRKAYEDGERQAQLNFESVHIRIRSQKLEKAMCCTLNTVSRIAEKMKKVKKIQSLSPT